MIGTGIVVEVNNADSVTPQFNNPSPALMKGDTITIQVQPRNTLDASALEGSLDVTFSIFRDGAATGLFSFVTGGE